MLFRSIEAALGDRRACHDGEWENAEWQAKQLVLDDERAGPGNAENDCDRDYSRAAPYRRRRVAVKQTVETADQGADPGHRMPDRA